MRRVAIPALLLSVFTTATADGRGQAEIDRFLGEYPAAARQLAERYGRVRGAAIIGTSRGQASEKRLVDAVDAVDGGRRKVTLVGRDGDSGSPASEQVVCVDGGSGFQLARTAGSSQHVIKGVDRGGNPERDFVNRFGKFLVAPFACSGTPFDELLRMDGARVVAADRDSIEGRDLLKVVIETGPADAANQITVSLDPAAGWVARRCELRLSGTQVPVIEYEAEYREGEAVPPLLSRVRFQESGRQYDCEFREISTEGSDPEEFTLAHYGLGPVELPASGRGSNRLWWLLGLAVIVLVVAMGVRMYARR